MHTHTHMYTHTCRCTCIHVRHMCKCLHIHAYIYKCAHIQTHECTHVHIRAHTCKYMCIHIRYTCKCVSSIHNTWQQAPHKTPRVELRKTRDDGSSLKCSTDHIPSSTSSTLRTKVCITLIQCSPRGMINGKALLTRTEEHTSPIICMLRQ